MEPIPAPIATELAVLHRQVRWLTAVCVFLTLGLVLTIAYRFLPVQPEVAANRFVLVDEHGRVRGRFGLWRDDSPLFQLNGPDGREWLLMVASADGATEFRILDSLHVHRVFIRSGRDGWPELRLSGPDAQSRVRLTTGPLGVGRIVRSDENGVATELR
jgi:hypothetical protein